jgi:hypothetical protein
MILISDIKYKYVEGDYIEIVKNMRPLLGYVKAIDESGEDSYLTVNQIREHVNGYRVVTPGGETVVGLTKEVADIFNISYEAFEEVKSRHSDAIYERDKARERADFFGRQYNDLLDELNNASLWLRIRWVFKGMMQ